MAYIKRALLCLLVVSTLNFPRADATNASTEDKPPTDPEAASESGGVVNDKDISDAALKLAENVPGAASESDGVVNAKDISDAALKLAENVPEAASESGEVVNAKGISDAALKLAENVPEAALESDGVVNDKDISDAALKLAENVPEAALESDGVVNATDISDAALKLAENVPEAALESDGVVNATDISDAALKLAENIKAQWDTQKGLDLIGDQLKKSKDDGKNELTRLQEEDSLDTDKLEKALEDILTGKGTNALLEATNGKITPGIISEIEAAGKSEVADELRKKLRLGETSEISDAAKVFAASAGLETGVETRRPWPWTRAFNAIRSTDTYACVTDPVRLLKKFFPSLDEQALRTVGSFFRLFSVRSLFTKKVLNILQSGVRGDFRPLVQGISNTLFAFKLKKINAEGGYIGHKLTIKNPLKDVYIKYFINPTTIKLGVAMTGLKAKVIDLKRLLGSSLNYVCTPIPGIVGASACVRMDVQHPLHGLGNQICMSGFMRYLFGDGPSMYFGCLKMNTPTVDGVVQTFSPNRDADDAPPTDGEIVLEEEDTEIIPGLEVIEGQEDDDQTTIQEAAQDENEEEEQQRSMFTGATDYLVDNLADILDRVQLSDEDRDTLERTKGALSKMMAFKDDYGRLMVTPGFVGSLFSSAPAQQSQDEIKETTEGESNEENGKEGEKDKPNEEESEKAAEPAKKKSFFYFY